MTTTLSLTIGTRVRRPACLNMSGFTAVVDRVEPWILGAGPKAGQQAKRKGEPLFTVHLTDVQIYEPAHRPATVDAHLESMSTRNFAAAASEEWISR